MTWGIATLSAMVAACSVDNPSSLRDTTGVEVTWSCDQGRCTTTEEPGNPPIPADCGDGTLRLVGAGGLALLCEVTPVDTGPVIHERTCRPLACGADTDCPQWSERAYACVNDICQSRDPMALDPVDFTALCLYDVPQPDTCAALDTDPTILERMALVDAACPDGVCGSVPSVCLMP